MLADGRFHSGVALGKALGVSRASICHAIHALELLGVDIYAVSGKGYRLAESCELLDVDAIREGLSPDVNALVSGIEVHLDLTSTNAYLLSRATHGLPSGWVCFAEHQSAGRGRRGRPWVSPFGGNVYLSVLWRFSSSTAVVNGLSPALGLAVAEALHEAAVPGVGVKWPNDVVWQGRKVAGVLLEMAGESAGPCFVVAGVGINVAMPRSAADTIDQPWADIIGITSAPVARNHLASVVLERVVATMRDFERDGFSRMAARWRARDAFAGKRAALQLPTESIEGTVEGVDDHGALLFERAGSTLAFTTGELSLRGLAD
jgi:BirA family biotin operon repressor/biotin-[acetyl-CoA-carboxylase] ligase